jgi:hypothetical protein
MREYTTQQTELVQRLRKLFGNDVVKAGSPDGHGWILVRMQSLAGEHHCRFDGEGKLRTAHITERLFDMPPQPKVKARNAQAL